MESNPSPKRRPGRQAHLKVSDRQDWRLSRWINGAETVREGEDCSGHDSETLRLSAAAGCGAQSEGSDDKMSFWIWSESFLNLIPPGLAPEIQMWHVAGRQKKKKKIKGNQINSCRSGRGRGRDTERRSEPLTCGFILNLQLCLFHLHKETFLIWSRQPVKVLKGGSGVFSLPQTAVNPNVFHLLSLVSDLFSLLWKSTGRVSRPELWWHNHRTLITKRLFEVCGWRVKRRQKCLHKLPERVT